MDIDSFESASPTVIKAPDYRDVEDRRDVITRLYWDEDRDLPDVMEIMQTQYHFKATERQYKGAFKRWGLQKNVTKDEMQHMYRIRQGRLDEGKATQFNLRKRAVANAKIDRWAQRTGHEQNVRRFGHPHMDKTPITIEYFTPTEYNEMLESSGLPASYQGSNNVATIYLNGLIDFTNCKKPSPQCLPLSPGYDIEKWFTQNGVNLSPRVIEELQRIAGRVHPAAVIISPVASQQHTPLNQVLSQRRDFWENLENTIVELNNQNEASMEIDMPADTQEMFNFDDHEEVQHEDNETLKRGSVRVDPEFPSLSDNLEENISARSRCCQVDRIEDVGIYERMFKHAVPMLDPIQEAEGLFDLDQIACLRGATSEGDLNAVHLILSTLLNVCQDIAELSPRLRVPLHEAARLGNHVIVETLLNCGADPLATCSGNGHELTSLDLAILSNQAETLEVIASFVMGAASGKQGGTTHPTEAIDRTIQLAMRENRLDCLEKLVKKLDASQDFPWNGTVHFAVRNNYVNALRVLVTNGINIDLPSTSLRYYPLYAMLGLAHRPPLQMFELLVQSGVCVDRLESPGETPLHLTSRGATRGSKDTERLLICGADANKRNKSGETPISCAVARGRVEDTLALLKHGARLDVQDHRGRFPLHRAADRFEFWENDGLTQLLIDWGASTDVEDHEGTTPLHAAALAKNYHSVDALLGAGANPYAQDNNGRTPLHCATRIPNRIHTMNIPLSKELINDLCWRITQRLLSAGATFNVKDNQGHTPLDYAADGLFERLI